MSNYIKLKDLDSSPLQECLSPEYTSIKAYSYSSLRYSLFLLASTLSIGILPSICFFYPALFCFIAKKDASNFREADCVLIKSFNNKKHIIATKNLVLDDNMAQLFGQGFFDSTGAPTHTIKFFEFRNQRYIYKHSQNSFQRLNLRVSNTISNLIDMKNGLTTIESSFLILFYGLNSIEIDSISIFNMILFKVSHPLYIFQFLSCILWILQEYYTYSIIIISLSLLSITHEIHSSKTHARNMEKQTKILQKSTVIRDKIRVVIDSTELVVGDSIILNDSNFIAAADILIIQGTLIVNESKLTGESIPILKQEIQFGQFLDKLDHQLHKTSILLCGSHVLDRVSNNDIIGIVIATGFNSKKGEIINSTLYPHNLNIQFHSDSYKFIGLLSIVALSAFINNLVIGVSKHSSFWQILATSFDLISIAVPPALPLLLTASIGISISRLKKSLILSTNPERILTAGSVDLICWDKTGTLTNPDLEYIGVDEFIGLVYTPSKIVETGLAICHEIDGNLQGRSIDLVLIKSTNWKIENYIENILIDGSSVETIVKITSPLNEVYTVIKRFEFNADIKRMSVLSYNVNSGLVLYAKGSPESIKSICEMKSIPKDFQKILKNYSNQGYYVLAIAYKPIKIDCSLIPETSRRQWESKLTFLGFIVLNSPIKSEASTIISELSAAKIRSVIITGDTHLTSIHCARQIGLCNEIAMIDIEENQLVFYYVAGSNRNSLEKHDFKSMDAINNIEKGHPDHRFEFEELTKHVNMSRTPLDLAVSGNALDMIQELYGDAFTSWLLSRTRIFTRTRPLQKTQIVEKLIFENWIVAYCGDGTNDVGALKASHIGLALDSTDASIVAPFTSGSKSISDLPMILCEGRCALETSFVAFKYMTLYPIIQLFLEASLYSMQTTLSNNQLLFDDLFLVLCTSILMCYAAPLTKIPTERSSTSLFAPHILATIVGQFLISISFFYIQFALLTSQIWFCSTSKATSGLDKSKWLPLNSTAPLNISYPCYHISRQDITGSGMLLGSQESTALWLYTHVQFLWVALALSALGKQRQPFYRNFIFVAYLIFAFIICFWLFLIDQEVGAFANTIKNWLNLREDDSIPLSYRFGLAFLTLLNGIISVLYEVFIVDKFVIPWTISRDEKQRIKRAQTRAKLAGVIGMNSGSKGRGNGMIKSSSVPNFSFADV